MNFAELSLCRVNFSENKKSTTPPFSIRSFSPSLFLEFSAATRSRVREFSREPVSSCQHPVSPRDTPIHYACTRANCARLCVFLRRANTRVAFIHTRESTPADCVESHTRRFVRQKLCRLRGRRVNLRELLAFRQMRSRASLSAGLSLTSSPSFPPTDETCTSICAVGLFARNVMSYKLRGCCENRYCIKGRVSPSDIFLWIWR